MSSKLASLHAGLIARKGEAMPAVAHPAFSYVDAPRPAPQPVRREDDRFEPRGFGSPVAPRQDDWTRAEEVPPRGPGDVPAMPAPAPVPVRAVPAQERPADDEPRPFRLTLRLTADQRRRLRIAAAREETSLQALLSAALDGHLDALCACDLRDCACLAREDGQRGAH